MKMIRIIFLFLCFLIPLKGERIATNYISWANIGIGLEQPIFRNYNTMPNVNFNYSFGVKNFYRVVFSTTGKQMFPEEFVIHSIGIGVGKRKVLNNFIGAVFIGPTFNWYELENPKQPLLLRKWEKYNSPGFAINSEILFRPEVLEFAVGLESFCNFNKVINGYGLRLIFCFSDGK